MPKFHSYLNIPYNLICILELLGDPVEMDNVPHVWEGKETEKSIIFEEPYEVRLFKEWLDGHFTEAHKQAAKGYRQNLTLIPQAHIPTLEKQILQFKGDQIFNDMKIDELNESIVKGKIKEFVNLILHKNSRNNLIKFCMDILGVVSEHRKNIMNRWKAGGGVALSDFAPYTTYVLSVYLYFYMIMRYEIGRKGKRPKLSDSANWIDFSYFFYLPFTNIFISKDNLHIDNIEYFIKKDQCFINGEDMKNDLKDLIGYYSKKSEAASQNLLQLIHYPPLEGDYLASKLYDQFYPSWREHARNPIKIAPELEQIINSQLDSPYKNSDGKIIKSMIHEKNNIPASWLRFEK
jgi:hypothetical protein